IGSYSNAIQLVIATFALLGGINFTLLYLVVLRRFKKVWNDDELRFFLLAVGVAVLIVSASLIFSGTSPGEAFRYAYFHVASFITSTGYVVADHTSWPPLAAFVLLTIMVTGACAGSTCGGVKSVRVLLLWRAIPAQIKKILHPRAVYIVRLNEAKVNEELLFKVLSFAVLYVVAIGLGTAALLMMGVDHITALSGVVSCVGNVGAAFGSVAGNYGGLPDAAKWVLTFLMLLGRLELFSVMVLFTAGFWEDN
ncbi:MAG: TrkH family potassium uptake protein, partial [Bacteroidales bacterium]